MENLTQNTNFLGVGWGFPPTFDIISPGVGMTEGVDDIYSSLHILLTTMQGERIMQPRYGCNLEDLIFEPLDTSLKTLIIDKIETAILLYEPRIVADKISITEQNDNEGLVEIKIDFTVKSTNSRFNFVFPFYKNEGTEILNFLLNPPSQDNSL
ncbi:MAG: GPW/gp25 family protein [Spirosomataceae bacterium]